MYTSRHPHGSGKDHLRKYLLKIHKKCLCSNMLSAKSDLNKHKQIHVTEFKYKASIVIKKIRKGMTR